MKETISYSHAVNAMALCVREKVVDAFTASTILATMFDREKEDTLDSIITIQEILKKSNVGHRPHTTI